MTIRPSFFVWISFAFRVFELLKSMFGGDDNDETLRKIG